MSIIKNLQKNDFIRSVTVLMTGTVIAQLINLAISPILTRIYLPEEMADLNLYMRLIGFLSALASAKFELTLPLPKRDEHSYLLYRLSIRIALYILLSVSVLSVLYILLTGFDIKIIYFSALTISSTLFLVLTNLGVNWAIRKKEYKRISASKILNTGVGSLLKWLFGLWGMGSFGLLLASFIGFFTSSITFVREWFKLDKQHSYIQSNKKTRVLINSYREFPMINLPHALIDLGRDLLLAFLIIIFFSKDVFGWYSLSYSALQLPLVVIGTSIGQVFFNRCAELVNKGQSTLPVLKKTVLLLSSISLVPFTLLFFFGKPLFAFVFGLNWANSGAYSEIMSIWFFVSFISSTISTLPMVLRRQKEFFFFGLSGAALQLFCFGVLPLIIGNTSADFITILKIASIAQSLLFIVIIGAIFRFAKLGVKKR